MRFISFFLIFSLTLTYSCKRNVNNVPRIQREYNLIKGFSKNLNKDTNLVLSAYGINNDLPKSYVFINGVANFSVSYKLIKNKDDVIDLEEARSLLVFVTESFLNEINSSPIVKPDLDVFPFTVDQVDISLYFIDENQIKLGNGVACVYFSKGKIKYQRYEIEEYRSVSPSIGKHFTIHEETYQNALDIVKRKDPLLSCDQQIDPGEKNRCGRRLLYQLPHWNS